MQIYELENATTSLNVSQTSPLPPYYGPLIATSANEVSDIGETPGTVAEFHFPNGVRLAGKNYAFVLQSAGHVFVWGTDNFVSAWSSPVQYDLNGRLISWNTVFTPLFIPALELARISIDPVDSDGDGIYDSLDTNVFTYSNDFTDATTTGSIISRGDQYVSVKDATSTSEGVVLAAQLNSGATSSIPATVSVCNNTASITLTDGDVVILTCGSVTLDVRAGEVEAELVADDGSLSSVRVSVGNTMTFHPTENTISAAPGNTGVIIVTVDGKEFVVTPGATVSLTPSTLIMINPAQVWIGLKHSDHVGTKFDVLGEVYKDGVLISSGQLNSANGGSSGFNNAKLNTILFNAFSPLEFPVGSLLSFKLSVRNTCTGPTHNSGTARLWFNDTVANSYFGALVGNTNSSYFLRDGFTFAVTPGAGPKKTIDVAVGAPCSAFKPFGTWTTL